MLDHLSLSSMIFQGIQNGILVVDHKEKIILCNQALCMIVKKQEDELVGNHLTTLLPNRDSAYNCGNGDVFYIYESPIYQDGRKYGSFLIWMNAGELKVLANQIQTMESKLDYYQKELKRLQGAKFSFHSIVGNSEKMKDIKNMATQVSKSRSTVLITGESGTGKELFAHAIHNASPRSAGPFIRLNCAAIPRDLLEAELFGFEDGAFTGAKKGGKPGKIELANNGTLFLDEIGDMPLEMQAKLLRVLQEKEIERIGGTKVRNIDVRYIAATNRNLYEMVREGQFREDLYYRLNVFTLEIPPLRERKTDIITLTDFLITKLNQQLGTHVHIVEEKVSDLLYEYDWPGNIRELENVLERAMNVIEGDAILLQHLPVYLVKKALKKKKLESNSDYKDIENYSLEKEIESTEKRVIIRALERALGNKQAAAKLLGIHRASLYRKMEKYQIE